MTKSHKRIKQRRYSTKRRHSTKRRRNTKRRHSTKRRRNTKRHHRRARMAGARRELRDYISNNQEKDMNALRPRFKALIEKEFPNMKDDKNLPELVLELITRFYDLQVLPEQLTDSADLPTQRIAKIKIDVAQSMAEDDTMDITHATKMVDLMKQYPYLNRHRAKIIAEDDTMDMTHARKMVELMAKYPSLNPHIPKKMVKLMAKNPSLNESEAREAAELFIGDHPRLSTEEWNIKTHHDRKPPNPPRRLLPRRLLPRRLLPRCLLPRCMLPRRLSPPVESSASKLSKSRSQEDPQLFEKFIGSEELTEEEKSSGSEELTEEEKSSGNEELTEEEKEKMEAEWDKHNDWVYKNIVAPRLRKGINSEDMDGEEI